MLKLLQNAITCIPQVWVIRKMQQNRAGLRHIKCSSSGMIRINNMTEDYSDWPLCIKGSAKSHLDKELSVPLVHNGLCDLGW